MILFYKLALVGKRDLFTTVRRKQCQTGAHGGQSYGFIEISGKRGKWQVIPFQGNVSYNEGYDERR